MMISKDKTEKQKDIDDVLSSIDSLLETAADIEVDDLPNLNIEDQSEPQNIEPKEITEKLVAPQKSRTSKKQPNKKVPAKRKITAKDSQPTKSEPATKESEIPKELQSAAEKIEPEKKPNPEIQTESKLQVEKEVPLAEKDKKTSEEKPDSRLNFSTVQADFSLTQQELPVLDEIITEEEMALIAAGKELPKRVITEKFVPKTTADKIIDTIAIQLADYNVTRLEYEYLHELIDEILEEEKKTDKNKKI